MSEANLLGVDSYYTARDTREAREPRNPSRNNQGRIQVILLIRIWYIDNIFYRYQFSSDFESRSGNPEEIVAQNMFLTRELELTINQFLRLLSNALNALFDTCTPIVLT